MIQQVETIAFLLKAGYKPVYFSGKYFKLAGRRFDNVHWRTAKAFLFRWRELRRRMKKQQQENV